MPNTLKNLQKSREPQLDEDEKDVAYIRGFTASDLVSRVMKDIYMLKKPIGTPMNRKNVVQPFEDIAPIEFMCQKNNCPLFLFTSHSKKRPHNLTMGRLYNGHILDMVEFGVDFYKSIEELGAKISLGMKPILIFTGEPFETEFDMIRIKNLLNDFFQGPRPSNIRVKGIEHVIMFIAHSGKIFIRPYLIEQKKIPGSEKTTATCHEMGPQLDLVVRRTQLADHEQFTQACKQKPKAAKSTKNKNVSHDELGTTHGKIHIGRQDFDKMYNVKY
jgi:ribosome production factor 2